MSGGPITVCDTMLGNSESQFGAGSSPTTAPVLILAQLASHHLRVLPNRVTMVALKSCHFGVASLGRSKVVQVQYVDRALDAARWAPG